MRIQAVNEIGTLLFLFFVLLLLSLLIVLFIRRWRGRPTEPTIVAIGLTVAAYAAILVAVSLSSQTRQIAMGTDKCFDDWCVTVMSVRALPAANASAGTKWLAVTLGISNHAQRAAFRPSQPRVFVELPSGDAIAPSAAAQQDFESHAGAQDSLAKRVVPGESFQTVLVFNVPVATHEVSIVILEGPPSITRFLVGDENSLFHKKIVFPVIAD